MIDIWSSIYFIERYEMTALKLSYVGLLELYLLRESWNIFE